MTHDKVEAVKTQLLKAAMVIDPNDYAGEQVVILDARNFYEALVMLNEMLPKQRQYKENANDE